MIEALPPVADGFVSTFPLSVVLPVFNEERNVNAMAARLAEIARQLGRWEILFIDDCSTDRTLAEIKSLAARDPHAASSPSRATSATRRRCAPACATPAATRSC